jgi:hypothetical protein
MSSAGRKSLDELTRKVVDLDDRVIDELYGLEPVFKPDEVLGDRAEPTRFVTVQCPYCAEQYETQVDLTAGSFTHIEDCYVCCRPIELGVEVDDKGRMRSVFAQRVD